MKRTIEMGFSEPRQVTIVYVSKGGDEFQTITVMSEEQAKRAIALNLKRRPSCPMADYSIGDDRWSQVFNADYRADGAEYPPVSGGADDDETACGALCQQHNDRMWAQLGPVADDAPMPW